LFDRSSISLKLSATLIEQTKGIVVLCFLVLEMAGECLLLFSLLLDGLASVARLELLLERRGSGNQLGEEREECRELTLKDDAL